MNKPIVSLESAPSDNSEIIVRADRVSVFYGDFLAVRDVSLKIAKNKIVAFIGPSGCGKSTMLRCFNRMNELIPNAKVEGKITFYETDLYGIDVDAIGVRRKIGMVFQKPNPFPKSIYKNIAYGASVNGYRGNMDELVEQSLRRAFLWDEVKDKLSESGLDLSGGQQQRLCIARAIASDRLFSSEVLLEKHFDFRLAVIIKQFNLKLLPSPIEGGFYKHLAT